MGSTTKKGIIMEITKDKIVMDRNKDKFMLIYGTDDHSDSLVTDKVLISYGVTLEDVISYLTSGVISVPLTLMDDPTDIETRDKVVMAILKDIRNTYRALTKWKHMKNG